MSLTVSRRTREIGIRKALGASPKAILESVFSRALVQLGLGAGFGAAVSMIGVSAMESMTLDSATTATLVANLGLASAVILVIALLGSLSCGLPVARVLRIQPIEAMRQDG